ncbi:MAG: efflux RND transporter periplasmic adaptor subunit [Prevotella sp.]|nr:efflux RND transporter periplasmic adaptor subunit [Prevotella sp.]
MIKICRMFVVAVAVSLTACSEKQERKSSPLTVETESVSVGSHLLSRTYVGKVEESASTSVSFTGSGMLTRVYVEEGQHVKRGQLIAQLDATQSRNMVAAAEAQMKQAKDALERMRLLHDNGSLAEMKWVETQSRVEQAQAQLDLARKSLADCSVYSPVNGIVGNKVMESGETVLPSMPVASVLNIDQVKVVVSVPEKEIVQFSAHTPTTISVEALEGRIFQGGTITKGIQADAMTHTYEIKIHLQNASHSLLPGMVCQVKVGAENERSSQMSVPITSVHKNVKGQQFVWTVKGGYAHRLIVETGRASGNRISVMRGLSEGDIVVTEGYQKLSEGCEVKVNNKVIDRK